MKRIILISIFAAFAAFSQSQTYKVNGNTITAEKVRETGEKHPKSTGMYFEDSKGIKYPIFEGAKGAFFIVRKSAKTGKEYRQYLPKEAAQLIKKSK